MSSFVSTREIEATKALKKQERREAREVVLRHAKADHERRKRREERHDEWIAPSIVNRFDTSTEENSSRSRKRKKGKSKEKKRSKYNKLSRDESSSHSDSDEWVERGQDESLDGSTNTSVEGENSKSRLQRESWMTTPVGPSESSLFAIEKNDEKKMDKESKVSPFDAPGQHPRELNPYWKQGGTGLPQEGSSFKESRTQRTGDGGRTWILRAYKRAVEQAKSEGRTLEEIASERWGSLEKLYSLLQAAGIDPKDPDRTPSSQRKEYLYAEPPRSTRASSPKHYSQCSTDYTNEKSTKQDRGFLIPGQSDKPHSAIDTIAKMYGKKQSGNWHKHQVRQKEEHLSSHGPTISTPLEQSSASSQPVANDPASSDPSSVEQEVTDAQLNALSAKIMKAEILGDSKKVDTLTKKLEKLRELKTYQEKQKSITKQRESQSIPEEKAIPLVSTDRFGRLRPMDMPRERGKQRSHAPPPKRGKRKKYTDDGEGYSIKDLMEQERKMSARDTQLAIAGMASKFVSSNTDQDTIDERHASKIAVSFDSQSNSKEIVHAMAESRKIAEAMETCRLCFGNDNFSKRLLVAVGIHVYLAVPATQSLCEGHCLLVPTEHHTSMILLDENVWEEIKVFQKGLTRMFSDRGSDVIFTESYMSATKRSHAYIECIPVPREQGEMAPMYFKKAIMESDEEWSMNRKIIDTKEKGVQNSLPTGLPYFYVEFGLDGGFAHIIENQDKFPSHFAKEVIGGILDLEPRRWLKPRQDSFETQKSKVVGLSEWWKPYDWTQQLKQS